MSAASQYYDYDAYVRSQHSDDPDDDCQCADCKSYADDLAADHAYESWKEDRMERYGR